MGFLRFFGTMSPAHIGFVRIFSRAKPVGTDQFGNRYFTAPPRPGYKRDRRWVLYDGAPEASMVPAEWHGWLHHQTDVVPSDAGSFRRSWQRGHKPNMTGTTEAYRPPGHILSGGKRQETTGDYQAWTPPE